MSIFQLILVCDLESRKCVLVNKPYSRLFFIVFSFTSQCIVMALVESEKLNFKFV